MYTAGNGTITGSIESAGYQVLIGSRQPSTNPSNPLDLDTQTRYPISLFSPQCQEDNTTECALTLNPFRGFLLRVGPGINGVDTTEAFELSEEDATHQVSQPAEVCMSTQDPPVGGLTHMDNSLKTQAGGYLTFKYADTNITLDVTVVARVCHNESKAPVEQCSPANSTYYFTRYYLEAVGEEQSTSSTGWIQGNHWLLVTCVCCPLCVYFVASA